ncbi:MAG: Ig-like domain-containing protein, partial [Clostridia bacterium]|nr:Ig-like domain-containing protein [Clostridia bacterium]
MKKKTQKALLSALVVATVATAATAAVLPVKLTVAETVGTTRFEMVEGASIRYSEPLGLRFIAELGQQEYADLKAPENGVIKKMGMYIMPWESISENDVITATDYASIEKLDYVFYSSDGSVDEKIYEYEDESGDTYYRANGVISNLKLHNYAREFVGIGYIAETKNGVTTYTYTDVCKEDNVRTSAYVAVEAHADSDYAENTTALSVFEQYIDGAQLYANWGVEQVDGGYKYGDVTYSTIEATKNAIENFKYSLTLDKSVKYVKEHGTAQLTATIKDVTHNVNFAGAHAVYTSSDESIVKVDENGTLTWVKNGTATITAEFAGIKQTCEVISGVVDFNDGKLPSYIQNGGRASLAVVDGNGGKVLQATSENNNQGNVRIMMPLTYLGAFFEDESVEYLAFDLKLPEGATTPVSSIMYHNLDQTNYTSYESTSFDATPTDAAKGYYLPRSVYEAWVANGKTEGRFLNVQAGITQGASYWIDNIRAVTEVDYTADLYSFETGSLRKNMDDGPGFCQPNYNQFHFKITGADASTAMFTNEIVSDGMRAIQFTKKAGESIIMFNGSSDPLMETEMREAGYVSFDLYVPEGSDAKIKHHNQAWYGALKQGWNTIYEKVDATNNELIRFVDTTASTYVIDNFRLLNEDEYNKAKFGFEAGGVIRDNNSNDATTNGGWAYYYAGWDKANNKASIQINEGT